MRVTINTQPKADEDIFKAGTLVQSTDCPLVVLVSDGETTELQFPGVIINGGSYNYVCGDYTNSWSKDSFVKFVGNVLLEQGV